MLMLGLEAYYRIIVDCWRMFRQFCMPQEADAYWQELLGEAHRICDLHGRGFFVKQLVYLVLDEIERRYAKLKED